MALPNEVIPLQQGLILQRGNAELVLHKLDDRLTVAFHDPDVDLLDLVPGLMYRALPTLNKDFYLQEVILPPEDLEAVLAAARHSPEILFASHVYQLAHSVESFIYLTNQLTIQFADSLTSEAKQQLIQRFALKKLRAIAGLDQTSLYQLTSRSPANPLKIAHQLAAMTEVKLAEANVIVPQELYSVPTDTHHREQWYLDAQQGVDAIGAWEITRGDRQVIVAVADVALDLDRPEFQGQGKIVAPYGFETNEHFPMPDSSQTSHGTACASVAIAADNNGAGFVGVAPNCALMPLQMSGYLDDDVLESMCAWAIEREAAVIVCSWNAAAVKLPLSLRQSLALHHAATAGRQGKGCVVVFAAGNANRPLDGVIYERGWSNQLLLGPTTWLNSYAIHPDVIAVNACTSQGGKAAYSNWGTAISVCAPSNNAPPHIWFSEQGEVGTAPLVEDPLAGADLFGGDLLLDCGGTSHACAIVAGVAALVVSVNPALTAAAVKQILEESADKILDPQGDRQLGLQLGHYNARGHSQWFGYGRVNARRAVELARDRLTHPLQPNSVIEVHNSEPLDIPDNDPAGILSSVAIAQTGKIKFVAVSVHVKHEYLGDLEIRLRKPDGQAVLLQNRTLGNQTNLNTVYTLDNTPTLQSLVAQPMAGEWSLWLVDIVPEDQGQLIAWSLKFWY